MKATLDDPAVLVAGGAGYIGSHTASLLARSGYRPVVLDNLCTGNRFALRYSPFYEGSIGDSELVRKICAQHKPVVGVILLAGHAYVGESTGNPGKYFQNNVSQTLSFLDSLIDAAIPWVVFSSSCSVYGIPKRIPVRENSPTDPLSPYAESKLFIEKTLRWYESAHGLRHICLRYFNAAGADPAGELGERHQPETHLIPLAIEAASGGAPLRIFGSDYPTPDGTAIRDYVHVTDLADAHVRALAHLVENRPSTILNLGTGKGHSVKQIVNSVEQVTGLPVPVEYAPRRAGDAPVLVADPGNAEHLLGWRPKFSSIETMVRTAWDWHTRDVCVPRRASAALASSGSYVRH